MGGYEDWSDELLKGKIKSLNADISATQQTLSYLNLELALANKELAKRQDNVPVIQ